MKTLDPTLATLLNSPAFKAAHLIEAGRAMHVPLAWRLPEALLPAGIPADRPDGFWRPDYFPGL